METGLTRDGSEQWMHNLHHGGQQQECKASVLAAQAGYARFTPHFMSRRCSYDAASEECSSNCIHHGRYCAVDSIGDDYESKFKGWQVHPAFLCSAWPTFGGPVPDACLRPPKGVLRALQHVPVAGSCGLMILNRRHGLQPLLLLAYDCLC